MIYVVDHVFKDPAIEPAWHEWYAGYLQRLLSVPGIHSAQRFKAIGHSPSRYLAMYSIDSEDVYSSAAYTGIGGGGSQSARFHFAYELWTRNLFAGLDRAPPVAAGKRLLAWDRSEPAEPGALGARATWLRSVGLHMTTPYRAIAILDPAEAEALPRPSGSILYEPFTDYLTSVR
jgi:hypothetical protein